MKCSRQLFAMIVLAQLVLLPGAWSQTQSERKVYAITAGTYTEMGGFWGVLEIRLPGRHQAYVEVVKAPSGATANLTIWGQDWQTPALTLTNGLVIEDLIHFQHSSVDCSINYVAVTAAGSLSLNGATVLPPRCCDFPYFFGHTNVVALPVPTVSAKTPSGPGSNLEIEWDSESNLVYQVQSCAGVTMSGWTNLGAPMEGINGPCRVVDLIQASEPRKFYRVLVRPKGP